MLDRADGGPARRPYRTTAARAGSLRARPLRPIPPAPAARPETNGSVRPAVPVRPAPVAAPVGLLASLIRRIALWGAGPDGENLAWRCAPVTRPPRRGLVRRLALWGAGDAGEYLAWGRQAVRLTAQQANPPVVLREMPSTPTVPSDPAQGSARGVFPRCGALPPPRASLGPRLR